MKRKIRTVRRITADEAFLRPTSQYEQFESGITPHQLPRAQHVLPHVLKKFSISRKR